MKTLLIVTIFLTNIFSAEYTYSNKNSTKIDMHGGKTDTLAPTSFKNLDVKKPISPIAPRTLVEEEKKKDDKKEIKK